MKILIDMGHPGHVHLFKNFIWEMEKRGHEFLITARKKEVSHQLLTNYGIDYVPVGEASAGKFNLLKEWVARDITIYKLASEFQPDILMGMANPCIVHAAKLLGKKSIILTDTEHAKLQNSLTFPFCDVILTPSCYLNDLGKKQVRYNGYHELAYLHPHYFTPDPRVLEDNGLTEDDTFIVLRFVSWGASHDKGHAGIIDKARLVDELKQYGRVLITSEKPLGKDFEQYRIRTSPEKLHDLLYYATLCVGEGATTASECAVLGTHAVYVNTLRLGYTNEEETKYDLVSNFSDKGTMGTDALKRSIDLLKMDNLWELGKEKRKRLLADKIDMTSFMIWFVENFPHSITIMKERPDIQRSFI
jgi:uncharacterized protein